MQEQAGRLMTFEEYAPQCVVAANRWIENHPQESGKDWNDTFSMVATLRNCIQRGIDNSPRDWTPCAEGLPTNSARYKVTLQVGSEAGTWLETAIIPYRYCDGTGEWILPKSDWLIYGVIAWTKADAPYRADDTTGKVKEDEFMREAMYDQLHSNGN